MNKRKIRIADIAHEAGVGVATVDRVLNNRPGVKEHTAKRIHEAIQRLENAADFSGQTLAGIKKLTFDFILPAGTNTFMQNLHDALVHAADHISSRGIQIRCHRIEGFNPTALAESIREIGPASNGLGVVALDNPIVREAVNDMADQNIPVVTLVSDLSNSRRHGYVGLDNRAAGRTAGYLMGRFAAQNKGQVVLIAGSIGLSYRDHQEREFGFRDALNEQFPNLIVIDRIDNKDDFEKAYAQTKKILETHGDLLGIYNIGAGNRGIGHALSERGNPQDMIFIGHEITSFSRQFLIEGVMDAVINQDVSHEANEALRMLMNHHMSTNPLPTLGPPRVEVLVRENLP